MIKINVNNFELNCEQLIVVQSHCNEILLCLFSVINVIKLRSETAISDKLYPKHLQTDMSVFILTLVVLTSFKRTRQFKNVSG